MCKDRGFIIIADDLGNEAVKTCECKKDEVIRSSLLRAGLGKYAEDKNFKDYETKEHWQKEIKQKAMQYSRNPKGWLSILGQSDTGKSHLGIATAKNIVALNTSKHFKSKYIVWTDIMYAMDYGKIPIELYNELVSVDLLYIDDFLKHKAITEITPAEDKLAFAIINARYSQNRLTIITSEWLINDLFNYHQALARRINEMSGDYLLQIGKDTNKMYNLK